MESTIQPTIPTKKEKKKINWPEIRNWSSFVLAIFTFIIANKLLTERPKIEISQQESESRAGTIYNHFIIRNTGKVDATNVVIRAAKLIRNSDYGLTEMSEFKAYSDTMNGVEITNFTRGSFPAGAIWNLDISVDTIEYNKVKKQNANLGCQYSSVPNVLSVSYTGGEKVRCK